MPSKKKLNLRELLSGIKIAPPIELDEICDDSRYLKKGDVFFACQGLNSHGLDFIESAVDSGAVAVIYELPYEIPKLEYEIPLIGIENLGEKLGEIANRCVTKVLISNLACINSRCRSALCLPIY